MKNSYHYQQAARNKESEINKLRERGLELKNSLIANETQLTKLMLEVGEKINHDMQIRQGYTEQIKEKVWAKGLAIEHTQLIHSIDHQRELVKIGMQSIVKSNTPDQDFCEIANRANKFVESLKPTVRSITNKWLECFDQIVAGEESAIQADIERNDIPPVNNQNQHLQQALQKIQELEQKLLQSDQAKLQAQQEKTQSQQETETLKIQVVEKDNKLLDKDNLISDLKEENTVKTNKIVDQSAKIMDLYEKVSVKTEEANSNNIKFIVEKHKVDDFKHKIDTYKTHFNHFIDQHENIDGHDQLVDMLGDLNIEQV